MASKPALVALLATEGGVDHLLAPTVGEWRARPTAGTVIGPNQRIGEVVILGEIRSLLTPPNTPIGRVRASTTESTLAVGFKSILFELETDRVTEKVGQRVEQAAATDGEFFLAPSSGRFWAKPSPDKPAFVQVGDTVNEGDHICMLEVMKTFARIAYTGNVPQPGVIVRACVEDGDDVERGRPLFELAAGPKSS